MNFICFAVFFTSGLQHAFVLFSDSIAQPAPGRCRSERVWNFPTSLLQRKIADVYTSALLATMVLVLRSSQPVSDTDAQAYTSSNNFPVLPTLAAVERVYSLDAEM